MEFLERISKKNDDKSENTSRKKQYFQKEGNILREKGNIMRKRRK
jgi:hypothetical protein